MPADQILVLNNLFGLEPRGSTHQAGYTIGWNTGGNSARTQKMRLNDSRKSSY